MKAGEPWKPLSDSWKRRSLCTVRASSVTRGAAGKSPLLQLVCLDDDDPGRELEILWDLELGAQIIQPESVDAHARRLVAQQCLYGLNAERAAEKGTAKKAHGSKGGSEGQESLF